MRTLICPLFLIALVSFTMAPLHPQDEMGLELEDDSLQDTTEETTTADSQGGGWFSEFHSTSGGEVTSENRAFEDDNDGNTHDYGIGLFARLEHSIDFKPVTTQVRAISRVDHIDPDRTIVYLEDAWVGFRIWRFYLKAGAQLINWTATEAFHPADIINSRNFDSNIENAEKIGEPMVSLEIEIPFGTFTAFYMPYYTTPKFAGSRSRLNFVTIPTGFTGGNNLKIDPNGHISSDEFGHQGALLWRISVGRFDLGLHAIEQVSRNYAQPVVQPTAGTVHALFPRLRQYGGQIQLVTGALISKAEVVYRQYQTYNSSVTAQYFQANGNSLAALEKVPDHTVAALGFEYGFDFQGGSELTFLLEGQQVFGLNSNQAETLETFQSDLLFGFRFAWNDILSKELLVSAIVDVERLVDSSKKQQLLINSSYSQRINEQWSFKLGARRIIAKQQGATPVGLEALDDANQYFLNISRHF